MKKIFVPILLVLISVISLSLNIGNDDNYKYGEALSEKSEVVVDNISRLSVSNSFNYQLEDLSSEK